MINAENRNFNDWIKILPEIKSNIIPPMTHPYGKVWEQPNLDEVHICNDYATMDEKAFRKLHDYSRSQPSAVYEGKMWKTSDEHDTNKNGDKIKRDKITWHLHWWGFSEDPMKCSGNVREIKIVNK